MKKDMPPSNRHFLLCDENLPSLLVKLLKDEGFDVISPIPSTNDEQIASLAKSENRIIVTFDRHFTNRLLFPPNKYAGIVLVRINPPLIKTVLSALLALFKTVSPSEFKGRIFSLSFSGFRFFPKNSE